MISIRHHIIRSNYFLPFLLFCFDFGFLCFDFLLERFVLRLVLLFFFLPPALFGGAAANQG